MHWLWLQTHKTNDFIQNKSFAPGLLLAPFSQEHLLGGFGSSWWPPFSMVLQKKLYLF